jgi:hypothetical protein
MLSTLTATRYITPLREGGSLPAVIEADDGQLYVMKFVGAGQGAKALIAEVIAGEIARALGLKTPGMVLLELDPVLARSEPNGEIRDLLRNSAGLNLGFRFLPSAFAYNPLLRPAPSAELASTVVWFDSYVLNVDRTPRNVNILLWEDDLWMIDHGAALYFHHTWNNASERSRAPFPLVRQHTLLPFASQVLAMDEALRTRLTDEVLEHSVALVPDVWLLAEPRFADFAEQRAAYLSFLVQRRDASALFAEEAANAYAQQH